MTVRDLIGSEKVEITGIEDVTEEVERRKSVKIEKRES